MLGLARVRSRIARLLRRRAFILSYHRIADVLVDPWDLAVRPEYFSEQLDVLVRLGRPTPLPKLARSMDYGRTTRGAIAVTFDDGYADNLLNARPLLERFGVPSTLFLSAGVLDSSTGFWWEDLTALFLTAGRLPDRLEIEVQGRVHRWAFDEAREYSVEDEVRHREWRGWHAEAPTPRHRAYLEIYRLLQPMREPPRKTLLTRLRSWAGRDSDRDPHLDAARVLSTREVAVIGTDLIEVGAHTMTHPRLSALEGGEKAYEIQESRRSLERIVGRAVTSFAYPYGQAGDYDADSVALVRQAGFALACANVPGPVTPRSDRFELPRFHVSDWNGEDFERNLMSWLIAA